MAEKNSFFESKQVKDFNDKLAKQHLGPLWSAIPELSCKEPQTQAIPYLWKGDDIRKLLMEATDIFTPERGGERRAIYLQNPGLSDRKPWGWASATQNIYAAVQLILPGEVAPSHRHTQSAMRFIMEGEGAYSIVEGERMFMEEGDYLTTPQGMWHGHAHEGDAPMIWLDVLDIPFIYALGGTFFESYPEKLQQPEREDNYSARHYAGGMVRPIADRKPKKSPVGTYRWAQTEAAIKGLRDFEPDPYDGMAVEFINPSDGRPASANIAAWLQMLPGGFHSTAHRHTNSSVLYVNSGSGYTVINGVQFDWTKGDILVIPSWAWHEHVNTSETDAYLFSVHDTPLMETFDLQREEEYTMNNGQQKVTGKFKPDLS